MKYLIVMPKGSSTGETTHSIIFPLGIAYVSASLKQAGHQVFTANLEYYEGDTPSVLRTLLLSNQIDVLCTGGLSRDCYKIKEVFEAARLINPQIITVVGGGIVSAAPEPTMRVLEADIGVIGEGEITMCELASVLDNGLPYSKVDGLIYKNEDGSFVQTPPRKENVDINNIPFPDFDGFNYAQYSKACGGLIVGSRSCPFNCTYCFHPSGKIYRQRSLDNIFKEIDYQIERFQISAFGFSEELFANDRNRVLEFCERIKDYNMSWTCALRVCDVDLEMLQKMRAAGCDMICYGLESANNSVLKSMRKNITVEQIEYALDSTYEANIRVEGQFIFGDINEDKHTVETTLAFWRRHNMQTQISLNMIIAYPGSYLYKYACKTGLIKNEDQFLMDGCPLINLSKLSDEEYHDLFSLTEELKLHPHTLAKSINIRDIQDNGSCRVAYICRKCNTQSEGSMFFWFKQAQACPACNLINEIDPFTVALHQPDAFFSQLPDDEEIVLWGAGGMYYKLINTYDTLFSKKFLLVDANQSKLGLKICSKLVHPPDLIMEKQIKSVIITALSQKDEISAIISKQYPSVEHIFIPGIQITETGIVPVLQALNQ